MSSSPSHIPRESVDIARTLRDVTLHIFRSSDDAGLSARFAEGHQAVLRAAGIRNLTSFGKDWLGDPETTMFLLTCQDDEVLLSGMRLQRRSGVGSLPMERRTLSGERKEDVLPLARYVLQPPTDAADQLGADSEPATICPAQYWSPTDEE